MDNQEKKITVAKKASFLNSLQSVSSIKKIVLGVCLFLIVLGLLYFGDPFITKIIGSGKIKPEFKLISGLAQSVAAGELPLPQEAKSKENPINGVLMTESEYAEMMQRHPIAMTVNNYSSARPQHGLSQADLVHEVLAEGGITRYLPVYYQNYDVPKVGPIRSLRYYMIELASGFNDAVILHHGWAGFDNAPFERYVERTDARGAVFKWDIKSLQSYASTYRDSEKARKSGYVHSLYTDFTRVKSELERYKSSYGWKLGEGQVEPLKFKFDEPLDKRGKGHSVETRFLSLSSTDYANRFTYNSASNTYDRFIAGNADIDLVTNQQITAKNVIIEWHNYANANDGHSRLVIDTIGEDNVLIFRDGLKLEGKWKKECRLCRTKYYDESGKEIKLNRGLIWVVVAVKAGESLVSNVNISDL